MPKQTVDWAALGLTRLPGRAERFYDETTGRTISRRQADKLRGKLSPEQLAKLNKQYHPERQQARPARGRKSARTKTKAPPKTWNQAFFREKRLAMIQPPDVLVLQKLWERIARWRAGFGYYVRALFMDTFDRETWLTLTPLTRTDNPPDLETIQHVITYGRFGSLEGVMVIALAVGVVFRTYG